MAQLPKGEVLSDEQQVYVPAWVHSLGVKLVHT